MPTESQSLSFRGLRVNFSIARPEALLRHRVLLLSSPLLTAFHWRKLLPELSELGCLVALVDLPGFGQSACGPGIPHESGVRAQLIWGVLDEVDRTIGGQNALWHLAAHGSACATVLNMVAMQPDSVRSSIHISPLLPYDGRGRAFPGKRGSSERLFQRVLSSEEAFEDFVAHAARRPLPDYSVERMWRPLLRSGARETFFKMLNTEDTLPKSHAFCPSIAMWGGADPFMPPDARDRLKALLPEIEPHVIRPAGHFPMETHSRALRDYLRGWLKYIG
ncbi:MAG: alpha/beta hydrolase [Clostridiales bacterium]|jgi:pimeloyl-ACP methyl ester carboxylesterase|nr:alpha/beta hydrolase [Clostridiales bacterium]